MPNDVAFAHNAPLTLNKTPKLRITPRVKRAIELMVNDGASYQDAAASAGLSTYAMRLALAKPHVMQFYKQQCDVLRGSHRARNIHRLCQIRDADDNMPAVNAIKALEQLNDEQTNKQNAPSPGVTIRIVNVTATPAQQTNAQALPEIIEQTNNDSNGNEL